MTDTANQRARPLSAPQASRVYDRIGRLQDSQAFYENPAIDDLIAHSDFEHAHRVLEIGSGTGRVARRLLEDLLPADARYRGVDVSPRMVALATRRLRPHARRAAVEVGDAVHRWPTDLGRPDRVLATFVFDLLDDDATAVLLERAATELDPAGALCVTGLTDGPSGAARQMSRAWGALWRRWPGLVGGCRPVQLHDRLEAGGWRIEHHRTVTAWLLSSEVVVARPPQR